MNVYIGKTKIKRKRGRDWPIFKKVQESHATKLYLLILLIKIKCDWYPDLSWCWSDAGATWHHIQEQGNAPTKGQSDYVAGRKEGDVWSRKNLKNNIIYQYTVLMGDCKAAEKPIVCIWKLIQLLTVILEAGCELIKYCWAISSSPFMKTILRTNNI